MSVHTSGSAVDSPRTGIWPPYTARTGGRIYRVRQGESFLAMPTIQEALARLSAGGLLASAANGPGIHILGGVSVSTGSGFPVYHDAFAIFSEPTGGFSAGVSGPGQLGEEVKVESLADAVSAVLRIYSKRSSVGDAGSGA